MAMTIELAEKDIRDGFAGMHFAVPSSHIIASAQRRRTRKRVAFGAIPAAGLIAAGGAALLEPDKIWAGSVFCYDTVDPKKLPFGSFAPVTTGESPEQLCAKEWRAGYLPYDNLDRSKAPYPVPPLTACLARGVGKARVDRFIRSSWIGVFPTNDPDFCATGPVARRMKLAEIPEGYTEHVERFDAMSNDTAVRMYDAVIAQGGSEKNACLDEASVRRLVVDLLTDHGYEDWTINTSHSNHDRTCWMHINFDNTRKEVTVYSTPRGIDEIWINDHGVFNNN